MFAAAAHSQTLRMDQYPGAAQLSDTDVTIVEQGGVLPAKQVSLGALKCFLLGSPITTGASSGSGSGPSERLDQFGGAATLGNPDITVIEQSAMQPATQQITLGGLQSYLAVPLTESMATAFGVWADGTGNVVSGP
jgi:hypothetical protein